MKVDLHIHTAISYDATGRPEEVLAQARKVGLDGIGITEHNSYEKRAVFQELAPKYGVAVFIGAEVATRTGHILVFSRDIQRWNRYQGINNDAQELLDEVNSIGGVAIAAHPYRLGISYGGNGVKRLKGLGAIEVCNGGSREDENRLARELAEAMSLPGTGGSDAHRLEEIGRSYTLFPERIATLEELVAAIKAGSCRCGRPGE